MTRKMETDIYLALGHGVLTQVVAKGSRGNDCSRRLTQEELALSARRGLPLEVAELI